MKFCTIERNSDNKVTRVNKPNGSESTLFNSIASHPLVKDTGSAVNIFLNKFSEKVKGTSVAKGNKLFNRPLKEAGEIADQFMKSIGKERPVYKKSRTIDRNRATVIAMEFEKMDDNPDELTLQAYEQMVEETKAQFEFITSKGYEVEVNNNEPYSSSGDMINDLRENKNMKIFSTESGFGDTAITAEQRRNNPLLQKTEFTDKNGVPLLANDLFRFVHDFFGHAELGNGFGPIGEENAWNVHVRMYSPLAARAMTTETRGQNSWVNFSGVNDEVFKVRDKARRLRKEGKTEEADKLVGEVYENMKFADQKVGLLPEWMSDPNGMPEFNDKEFNELDTESQAALLGYTKNSEGSKIVKDGKFIHKKGTTLSVDEVVDRRLMTEEEVELLEEWEGRINMFGNRGGISGGIASYNASRGTINIHLNNPIGEIAFSNQEEVNRAVLHEIIHSQIDKNVENKEAFNEELTAIVTELTNNKDKASPYVKRIIGFIEEGAPEEVLTYMLTTKSLAEFMSKIKSTKEGASTSSITLWDRLVNAIKRALDNFSLLDEAVDVLNKYSTTQKSNSKLNKDINSIKTSSKEESRGGTYEVTKDMYKKGGIVLPVISLNTTQEELSEELIDEVIKKYKGVINSNDLKIGIYKFPNSNVVSIDLNLVTPQSNKSVALPIATALRQESIYNLDTVETIPTGQDGLDTKELSNSEIAEVREALLQKDVNLVGDMLGIEPKLVHRVNGRMMDSFLEALKQSKEGDTIEIGMTINGEFTPLVLTRRNTNKNTEEGYINNQIVNGIVSEKKTKVGTEYRFQINGESELAKVMNMTILKDDATAYLGFKGLETDGNTLMFNKTKGKISVITKSGDTIIIDSKSLDEMTYEELKDKFESHDEIIALREWQASRVAYREQEPVISQREPVKSEEELQVRLLNFLNKLGVKTMSINEYVKKYKMKHGVNPSAKALADIANQVVAYAKGDVVSLSEEVAHFINEAFPKDKINNILRNIHKTAEWAEFNQQYREVYSKEYQGEALEDVVRREVLGKIVAKVISGQLALENSTELQRNIFERVLDSIKELFNKINSYLRPEYDSELTQYLNEVEEMLSAEDISDYVNVSNFKDSTIRLYNLDNSSTSNVDKLRKQAKLFASQLQDMEKKLLTAGSGSKSNVKELSRIQNQLDDALTTESILSLVSMVNANVRALNAAIKDSEANNKSYFLSDEEAIVYQNVKQISGKAVAEVQALLSNIKKEEKTRKYDDVIKELESTSSNITQLEAKAKLIDSQNVQRIVNRIMDKYPVAAENRDMIEKWIEHAEADTNLFHSTFGQLVHAKDGMLTLAGTIIKDMHLSAHDRYLSAVKKYQNRLKELGVTESDIGKEFVDGQYIISEYDFNKFEQAMDLIYVQTYKEVITNALTDPATEASKLDRYKELSNMSLEELVVAKRNNELEVLSLREETAKKNLERPLTSALIERTMVDTYYEEYEERLKNANISDITKQRLSDYLSDVSAIKKKAYRKEGGKTVLDYNSLTEFDKKRLSELHKSRKLMKSYTDESGQLKPGLKYIRVNGEFQTDPETGQPLVGVLSQQALTDEAKVALELNRLDKEFSQDKKEQDAKLFYETLDKIDREQGREQALNFLEANAYIGFKQEFWDNLRTGGGIVARLEAFMEQNPDRREEVKNTLFNIKLLSYEIKNIIKLHNKKNNPAEVDTTLMSSTAIDSVKELQKDLKNEMQRAKKLMGDDSNLTITEEGMLTGVSEVNQSYKDMLKDLNIEEDPQYDTESEELEKANEEVNFAVKHMTVENANRIEEDRLSIGRFTTGSRANPSKRVEYIMEDLGLSLSDLHKPEVQAVVLRNIARRNVLPYYKRYTSEGYTEFMDGLESTQNLSEYLQNSSQVKEAFVEVNPNPTFFDEQENESLNPNYNKEFKGGYLQPKLGNITLPKDPKFDNLRELLGNSFSFKNEKFEEKFGEVNDGISLKNDNLYQAYKATLEFNEEALDAMNIGGSYNQYLLPQIRKRKLQRFSQMFKGDVLSNARNFVKDAFSYTEDDMIQGDTTYGSEIKVIPKMYINKLENPEDISNDLFFSLALRAKEAYQREAKVKHYGDLMSIFDKVSTREMNGKNPETSNTFKMLKSAIDYNLFGIKETVTYPVKTPFGTVDLTKLARLLLGFVKFRNLGLNIVIPLTSLLTGEVTRKMETLTAEFIDRRSQALGTKEYRKIAPQGMKEVGKINTEAKINVLGQFFKSFDVMDSFDNSNYNKFLRFLPRVGMALHSAANYGIYSKTLLGVLHDFRVVDGKMINRNDFLAMKKAEGISIKDAKTEWRKHEDKVMYKYLIHDKNDIRWDREALSEVLLEDGETLNDEQLSTAINDMYTRAQKHASLVNSLIDGQIPEEDRVYAQRHYLLSYFMTHRGWLSIAIARRFKSRHLNLDTQLLEEGSYRSVYHYLGSLIREMSQSNISNFLQSFKRTWKDPTGINEEGITEEERGKRMKEADLVRKNMRRVGLEASVLTGLMVLSLVLRGFADDEDNEDMFALQMSNYMLFRTINELSSVQLNITSNMVEAIEAPFVGMNTIKNFGDVGQLFSGDEVKHGNYRGMTERGRFLTKMVPGMKQYFDLQNMNQTYDTYKFYNEKNFSLTPANMLWLNMEK